MSKSARVGLAIFLLLPVTVFPQQNPEPATPAPQAPMLAPPAAPAPPVDAGDGRIHLDVVVTDKAGKAVSGLELKDFTLLDDNRPSKILSFRAIDAVAQAASQPVEVVLLLDAANLGFQRVSQSRTQIANFLRSNGGHLAEPVSIFVFNDDGVKVLAQASTDGNALATQLDKADSQLRIISRSSQYRGFGLFGLSLKWISTIAQSEAQRPGKKLLIWAGAGWPLLDRPNIDISAKAQQQLFNSIVYLSTTLREGHISLYSVSLGDSIQDAFLYQDFLKGVKMAEKADPGNLSLKVLAVETGGRVLGPDNDIAAQIAKCVQDAGAFYTISFDPPKADRANEYHDLRVQVAQPGLTARTNTGYYNQP
ncbi:MAG: VWA domain-containing protein [Terracidiphilus sp.]